MTAQTEKGKTWAVGYNETQRRWMVWSDESPAIAFCLNADDAAKIADLLNAQPALLEALRELADEADYQLQRGHPTSHRLCEEIEQARAAIRLVENQ